MWDDCVEGSYRQAIPNMQQASATLVEVGKEGSISASKLTERETSPKRMDASTEIS